MFLKLQKWVCIELKDPNTVRFSCMLLCHCHGPTKTLQPLRGGGLSTQAVQVIPCSALGIAKDIRFQPVSYEPIAASHVISIVQDQF